MDNLEVPRHATRHVRATALALVTVAVAGMEGVATSACRREGTPDTRSTRPLGYAPRSGPFWGGQLVFIDVEEPASAVGSAAIACRFGRHPPAAGEYDASSGRYVCRTPGHHRPEPVPLTITIGGAEFPMQDRYLYTSYGLGDVPVTEVDVPAFQKQVKWVRDQIPSEIRFCPVVKNGEPVGWFAEAIARAVEVDCFCVERMQDGISLREAGVGAPIIVLYMTEARHVPELLHYKLEPAAYSLAWVEEANRLLERARDTLKVHLWIDTGLSREGVMPDEAVALARAIANSPKLHLQGIATHFCCDDEGDLAEIKKGNLENQTVLQKHRFDEAVKAIRAEGIGHDAIIHAGASDVLRYRLTPLYYDMLRIGTLLFENPPSEPPNYAWKTNILQLKTLPAGACVGYGCDVRVDADTRVALVGHVVNKEVAYYVRGHRLPVMMNDRQTIVLDISQLPDVREGEEVTLVVDKPNSPLDLDDVTPATLRDEGLAEKRKDF